MSSFASEAVKSKSEHIILVELDVGIDNDQWINHGAGIWAVNAVNLYDWVDDTLLEGFTAQQFRPIASVTVDGEAFTQGTSLLDISDSPETFYYERTTRTLYAVFSNYDQPWIFNSISIGQTFAYSRRGFSPINGDPVEGRLATTPSVGSVRDPLFFGRITFTSSTLQLHNADGEFDTWGKDLDIYGNECRVYIGFEDVDKTDWLRVFTGFMEAITVSESRMVISALDKRKQLTKPITYSCTDTNALTAIQEILSQAYGVTYDSTFYDTVSWEIARTSVEDVTIDMQEPDAVINVIEGIALSVFGFFRVNADGLFTFRVVDEADTIETLIEQFDILNEHSITYDPTQVVSSVRVGYNRDWALDSYDYFTDDTREASVFNVYKTYNEREFLTYLPGATAATALGTRILDYVDTVRGVETIVVPLENYAVQLGDQVGVVIQRGDQPMLGEYKAEVVGVEYTLDAPLMRLTLRHGAETEDVRITEDSQYRQTEQGDIRMVES